MLHRVKSTRMTRIVTIATTLQNRSEREFGTDSSLEEHGLEPLVPAKWTTATRPSLAPGAHARPAGETNSFTGGADTFTGGADSFTGGPTVRIRLPPAVSL